MAAFEDVKKAAESLTNDERATLINSLSNGKVNIPPFPGEEREECLVGRILIGKTTIGHQAKLEKLGYGVSVEDGTMRNKLTGNVDNVKFLFVDCQGFVDDIHVNDLQKLVDEKKLIHYRTRIDFGAGQVMWGVKAIPLLGGWSCLMAAPLDTLTADR